MKHNAFELRRQRQSKKWSGEHLAELTGVAAKTMYRIEIGVSLPRYDVLVKLEDLFVLSHRELFKPMEKK